MQNVLCEQKQSKSLLLKTAVFSCADCVFGQAENGQKFPHFEQDFLIDGFMAAL